MTPPAPVLAAARPSPAEAASASSFAIAAAAHASCSSLRASRREGENTSESVMRGCSKSDARAQSRVAAPPRHLPQRKQHNQVVREGRFFARARQHAPHSRRAATRSRSLGAHGLCITTRSRELQRPLLRHGRRLRDRKRRRRRRSRRLHGGGLRARCTRLGRGSARILTQLLALRAQLLVLLGKRSGVRREARNELVALGCENGRR